MSYVTFNLSTLLSDKAPNLSLLALPASMVLAALPHWYTIVLAEVNKVQGGWSNVNPRSWVAQLNSKAASGKKLTALELKILRGQSCQANAFENVPLFAAAIAVGNLAKLPNSSLNSFVLTYLLSRALFTYFYLSTETKAASFLRTAVFQVGVLYIWYIFIKAGYKLQ
ncbi:hypothetical protein IE53DRAFT_384039 [Violaceomyces palustris]|uniref:Uncharacterized protein n=1 Tax=Violaceomyces palustris TaxID=1673888 RepID=A0ACD0P5Y5_9BASI|nr:hypothetical protein IE53DRAFT_384039 [Violaceomyces palustris]